MTRKNGYWIAGWVALVVLTGFLAFGHGGGGAYGPSYGPTQGWGHMGGWGNGYRGDTGPGMMGRGGYGQGWGAGGWGMMGSNAAGMPGMGYGMSSGPYAMMSWALPDLTPVQEEKITQLQNDPQARLRTLMQQVWAAQASLMRLHAAEKRDWSAIRAAATALLELQRRQIEVAIDLQQKTDALLTDSQRKEMARARRSYGWMGAQ